MPDKGKILAVDPQHQGYGGEVLLGKYLADTVSNTFNVVASPIRLIAFGMTDDTVRVLRVWRSPSSGARDTCGDLLPSGEVFEMPYHVGCKDVVLSAKTPEVVLDGLGEYRLEYVGNKRPDVHVVYYPDSVVRVNDTIRGIRCACCACCED